MLGRLADADSAITLHVRVSSHRDNARAGSADVPSQQQQIHNLLHVLSAAKVLGDTHPEAGHDVVGLEVDLGRLFELDPKQGRTAFRLRATAST